MSTTPVLELDGVTAGYGRTTVLRDVSFAVAPGSVVAVLGPNGAGKTTTLRLVAGLIAPTSGAGRVKGDDVSKLRANRRAKRGVCLIPEGRGIFRSLTVADNLRLQTPKRHEAQAVEKAVAAFPILGDRLTQVAGSMSGGQQQMLALARAYLAEPDVVALDEVSMGLAPKIVDEIFESLRTLAAAGTALVLVEQYVHQALEMADTVVLLDRGTTSYVGPASAIDQQELLRSYLGTHEPSLGA